MIINSSTINKSIQHRQGIEQKFRCYLSSQLIINCLSIKLFVYCLYQHVKSVNTGNSCRLVFFCLSSLSLSCLSQSCLSRSCLSLSCLSLTMSESSCLHRSCRSSTVSKASCLSRSCLSHHGKADHVYRVTLANPSAMPC